MNKARYSAFAILLIAIDVLAVVGLTAGVIHDEIDGIFYFMTVLLFVIAGVCAFFGLRK